MVGKDHGEDRGENNDDEAVQKAQGCHHHSSLPSWLFIGFGKLLFGDIGVAVSEENEEQNETRRARLASSGCGRGRANKHECKADPLHPELSYSKKACNTLKRLELLAAGDVLAGLGQGEDVGEAGGRGCGAEQDEPGGNALRGPAGDDSVVLREVGNQESDEDDAGSR